MISTPKAMPFVSRPELEDRHCSGFGQAPRSSARGTRHAAGAFTMLSVLCVIGAVWFIGATLFVFALALAAKKRMPSVEEDVVALEEAA